MARTKKPYLCCGATAGYGRPASEVICYDCRALMSLGKAYKQHLEGAIQEPDTILVKAPAEQDWDCPGFYTQHSHGDTFKSIGQMLKRLIYTLAIKARHFDDDLGSNKNWTTLRQREVNIIDNHKTESREAFHVAKGHNWNITEPILINRENKELIEKLIIAIDVALRKSEEAGVEYGQHQLKQLVNEEITVNELSDVAEGNF